jgi:membrane protein YqaA with SNARE-associated domain
MFNLFLDWRLWTLDIILAVITVTASVAKYQVGRGGFQYLKDHYPQVSDERWERVNSYFDRWGAPLILISFLPLLTWIILPAAGAFGIRFRPFLVFAFLAKMIRYWIMIFIVVGSSRLIF